jgi:hypothetical protein
LFQYPIAENLNKDEVKGNVGELTSFVYTISAYLQLLQLISVRFDGALNSCPLSVLYNMASMIFELNVHEKPLDTLVDHLQKNQLDETINIDALEKTCLQLIVGDLF